MISSIINFISSLSRDGLIVTITSISLTTIIILFFLGIFDYKPPKH